MTDQNAPAAATDNMQLFYKRVPFCEFDFLRRNQATISVVIVPTTGAARKPMQAVMPEAMACSLRAASSTWTKISRNQKRDESDDRTDDKRTDIDHEGAFHALTVFLAESFRLPVNPRQRDEDFFQMA